MENVDGMIGPGGRRKPFVRFRLSEPWIENFRHAGNSNNLIPTQCTMQLLWEEFQKHFF